MPPEVIVDEPSRLAEAAVRIVTAERKRALADHGAFAVALLAAAPASAGVPLLRLGPGETFGNLVTPGDQGSSPRIDVAPVFPAGIRFGGQTFTAVYVNIDGHISFGRELPNFTGPSLPGAPMPLVAGWLGDLTSFGTTIPDAGVFWHVDS